MFTCSTLKSLFRLFDVSILISRALPQADRSRSHLFSSPILKASFIEKCVSFSHRSSQREIRYLPPPQPPSLPPFPLPPSGRDPTNAQSPLIYPAGTHELMSHFDHWLQINFTMLGVILFYQSDSQLPRFPVMFKHPLQLEMPQIKG